MIGLELGMILKFLSTFGLVLLTASGAVAVVLQDSDQPISVFDRLNHKAAVAKSNRSNDIANLIDEILSGAPDAVKDQKGKLLSAELDFRNGKFSGIKEEDVASSINWLAVELDAPEFAKTSKKQRANASIAMWQLKP